MNFLSYFSNQYLFPSLQNECNDLKIMTIGPWIFTANCSPYIIFDSCEKLYFNIKNFTKPCDHSQKKFIKKKKKTIM